MSMQLATYNYSKASSNEKNKSIQKRTETHTSNVKQPHPVEIIQRVRMHPDSLTHNDVMQLQSTIGNRAVIQLLSKLQSRRRSLEKESPMQLKKEQQERVHSSGKNNTGMPSNLKAGLEKLSNMNLSDVRVHRNSDKPEKVQALAYTQGNNIYVGPGQEKHLPHEGWHVVQQKQGRVRPTLQMKRGVPVNDDVELEKEADIMGSKAVSIQKDLVPGSAIQLQKYSVIQSKSDKGNVIQLAKQKNKTIDSALDILQTLLDLVGFIPAIGDAVDALNVAICLLRGDTEGAAFAAIAIVPVVGSVISTPLKAIYRAAGDAKKIKKAIGILSDLFGNTKKIISVLDDVYKSAAAFARKIPDKVSNLADNWLVKKALGKDGIKALEDAVESLRKGIDNLIAKVDEIINSVKSAIKEASDEVPKGATEGSSVKILGKGSTGRTTANNLTEQLAMKEVKSNPLEGAKELTSIKMTDSRWLASDGWVKMSKNVNGVEIHYVYNTKTGAFDDFKFK